MTLGIGLRFDFGPFVSLHLNRLVGSFEPVGSVLAQAIEQNFLGLRRALLQTVKGTQAAAVNVDFKFRVIRRSRSRIGSPWLFYSSMLGPGLSVHFFTTKDTKSTKESENETFDSISQLCHVEVHQQTDLHPCQFSIGQQLGCVNVPHLLDTLPFDN